MIKSFPKKFFRSATEERDEFISKVLSLSKKYGCNQIMIAFSRPATSTQDLWCYRATADLDVLVDFLEEVVIPTFKGEDVV